VNQSAITIVIWLIVTLICLIDLALLAKVMA